MGIITVSIDNQVERKLRLIASVLYSKRKGYLGKAITDALEEWTDRKKGDSIVKSLSLLEKGIDMGKLKTTRPEWHER